jgi:hypothetical protein
MDNIMKTNNNTFKLLILIIILVIGVLVISRLPKRMPVIEQPKIAETQRVIGLEQPCYDDGVEVECKG